MADQEHGHYVDAGLLGEDVRQLGHGAEMEVPPPLIHVGNEYFQYQAGLCKVEPPWHEPDIGIPFNVPQNVPSQCAFRSTSLDYSEWQGPRLLLMDGKNGMVKLKICLERRSVWFMTTAREMSGFDELLGNVLSQLGCWRNPGCMVEPTLQVMAIHGAIVRKKEEKKNQDCVYVSHLKPFRLSATSGKASVKSTVVKTPASIIKKKKTTVDQVKEKTPKVVRWCDQQTRAVDQEQHCEKDASSTPGLSDERVGGHVLRSRRRLKSPTRLDL
ncbi:hypothetical protein DAPPUDRAFT_120778 [Daphnia pulex]|uniref:Uncharacterized protein n=1 Tax=Daphnia pulex TaxID=6669 RepID=E9I270_DAPPU|nr:hypothetical protein DAPPUDRAFT_120778 [Daphnia pulex]|eukprot:EFX61910.1 hypothetical protein DAPPUDRAFT_120778 [Daphnia pulex]